MRSSQQTKSDERDQAESNSASRGDVYSRVTAKIVADLEQGVRPWLKPWSAEHAAGKITRPLRHNGLPYSGINVLMLWGAALEQGFVAPIWMTFRQSKELGAHVRKGEKGSLVVYANSVTKKEESDDGEEVEREVHFLKGYSVFNIEQIEGLPEHYYGKPERRFPSPELRHQAAKTFFAATGATVRYGGGQAYYSKQGDYIRMPPIEAFRDEESFWATLGHETLHWSGGPNRLAREFGRKAWGDEAYAKEELVAELGSAFLCADLELTPEVREDHAAYLQSWLKVLKSDVRAIFQAAAHAQRAVDYLHRLQPERGPPEPA